MKRCLPIVLILISVSSHGAVNTWRDSKGRVQYSDEAPPPDVKAHTLNTPKAASGVEPQKSFLELEAERKKSLKERQDAAQNAAKQQKNVQEKQKSCELAKSNLAAFESNSPVAKYNDKGEKILLDDSARKQGIEEARKQINDYCN